MRSNPNSLLTGDEGEFKLYDSKKAGPFWKHQPEKSEEASKEGDKEAQAASGKPSETTPVAADQTSTEVQATPEEAKKFQEFQEWKKSAAGKAEYQEFLEWKEWKAYQKWKKQQGQ
jgi:hypothetical protein